MISYKTASKDDLPLLMKSRLEMLKEVNELPEDHILTKNLSKGAVHIFRMRIRLQSWRSMKM